MGDLHFDSVEKNFLAASKARRASTIRATQGPARQDLDPAARAGPGRRHRFDVELGTGAKAALAKGFVGRAQQRNLDARTLADAHLEAVNGFGSALSGKLIDLIEQGTNATVAAGMLNSPREIVKPENGDYVI